MGRPSGPLARLQKEPSVSELIKVKVGCENLVSNEDPGSPSPTGGRNALQCLLSFCHPKR